MAVKTVIGVGQHTIMFRVKIFKLTHKVVSHGRKVILYLWLDHRAIMQIAFIKHNEIYNAHSHVIQLQHVNKILVEKRATDINKKKGFLHHYKAKQQRARIR